MNALNELVALLQPILPVETINFNHNPPPEYAVLTPLIDEDVCFRDDSPAYEMQEVRISIYTKKNYINLKNRIVKAVRKADFTITEKRFIELEDDTGYYHYAVDTAKIYETEE